MRREPLTKTNRMEENQEIVKNMLDKLTNMGTDISWKINNSYTDGIEKTIYEVRIYQHDQQAGRIAYQAENGQVLNYRYKKLEKRLPITVSDVLLDIIGFEIRATKATQPIAF